jgi:hypothetical protein
MNRNARTTAGIVLVVIGIAALVYYIAGHDKSEFYEHTLPLGDRVREIRIDSGNLDLDIRFAASASGDNAVKIEGKASPGIVKRIRSAEVENGVLHLQFKEPRRWRWDFFPFRALNGKQTVTVELTDEAMAALESFRADADSGSLQVSGAVARESVIASDSGSIRIGSLKGNAATVRTDSGSIRLERFEGGSLSLRSDSGGIHAGTVNAGLKAGSDSGGIRVERLNGYGEIRTISGSVHVVKDDDTGLAVTTDSGSVRITVPASYGGTYDLMSDTGSVSHPEPAGTSGEVIRVRTDSGSIRIEQ